MTFSMCGSYRNDTDLERPTKRNKVSRKSKKFQDFDKAMEWSHMQM